jgi:hypothetical protein
VRQQRRRGGHWLLRSIGSQPHTTGAQHALCFAGGLAGLGRCRRWCGWQAAAHRGCARAVPRVRVELGFRSRFAKIQRCSNRRWRCKLIRCMQQGRDGQLQGQRPHSHNAAGFVRLIPAKMAPGVPRNGLVWPTLRMPAPYWRGICVGGDHSAGRRSSGASSGSRTISLGLRNHPDAVRRPI